MRALVALGLSLALAACAASPSASVAETAPPAPLLATDPPSGPGEVDRTCRTDADCTVKNVGNCCGYFPACVNVDSPTFPEQVKAECERNGTASVCGFEEISACQCVQQRCEAAPAAVGEAIR
jgi:hypothetical protein